MEVVEVVDCGASEGGPEDIPKPNRRDMVGVKKYEEEEDPPAVEELPPVSDVESASLEANFPKLRSLVLETRVLAGAEEEEPALLLLAMPSAPPSSTAGCLARARSCCSDDKGGGSIMCMYSLASSSFCMTESRTSIRQSSQERSCTGDANLRENFSCLVEPLWFTTRPTVKKTSVQGSRLMASSLTSAVLKSFLAFPSILATSGATCNKQHPSGGHTAKIAAGCPCASSLQ